MKIAISGAVSTGKTTLGKALAGRLQLPFIEENLEAMFGSNREDGNRADAMAAGLFECLETKRALEQQHDGFVVDRSPVDILNFWFAGRLAPHPDTQKIYDLAEVYLADYDAVILLPWGVIELEPAPAGETAMRRRMDVWAQFRGSVTISGLANHFVADERLIRIPNSVQSHDERLNFAIESVDRIGKIDSTP